MATIFTKIIQGEIPCYKVGEDAENLAFLDINPLVVGHTLVVPKIEVDELFELPTDRLLSLMSFAQEVARRIKQSIECKRVAMVVLGLDVPHAHIHLIPMSTMADVDFSRPKMSLTKEEFQAIAQMLE